MNISKQAIEAGAEAEWNSLPGPRWKNLSEEQRDHRKAQFAAGLTTALEHIIPKECDDALYKIFWDAYNDAPMNILRPIKTTQDAHKAGFSAVLSHLRGEGKADCNIQPKNVQSQPEIETQVGIDPDDVERVETAIALDVAIRHGIQKPSEYAEGHWKQFITDATAAIRAMKGQVWGVCNIQTNKWVEFDGKVFTTNDENAAKCVKWLADSYWPRIHHHVTPYTAPREESADADEIASKICDGQSPGNTKYSELIPKIAQAIREAEKRGTAKCG